MSLEFWELRQAPTEDDKERWQLKLKLPASELISFLNNLPGIIGNPTKIEENDFDFQVFIYEVKTGILPLITEFLKEKCSVGVVFEETKKGAFESMLEKLANSIDSLRSGSSERKEETAPKPETPAATPPAAAPETKESGKIQAQEQIKESVPEPAITASEPLTDKDIADIFHVDYNPKYVFENFTISKGREQILSAIKSIAENPGQSHNPVLIQAAQGTGKTHILHAIAQYAKSRQNNLNVFFIEPTLFIKQMSNSFKDGSLFSAKRYFLRSDILLVDNIEAFKESVIYQKQLYSIFKYLIQVKKQIVITSVFAPGQLSFLDTKLFQIIESGFTMKIGGSDLDFRAELIKNTAKSREVDLDEQQIAYLAPKLPSSNSFIDAFFKRLRIYKSLTPGGLNNDIFEKVLVEVNSAYKNTEDAQQPAPAKIAPPPAAENAPENTKVNQPQLLSPPPADAAGANAQTPPPVETSMPRYGQEKSNDVKVGVFYPEGFTKEFDTLQMKIQECFDTGRILFVFEYNVIKSYSYFDWPNYKVITDECAANNVNAALILGFSKSEAAVKNIPPLEEIIEILNLNPANKGILIKPLIFKDISMAELNEIITAIGISLGFGKPPSQQNPPA